MVSAISACRYCGGPLPPVSVARVRRALEQLGAALDPRSADYPGDERLRSFVRTYLDGTLAWMDRRCTACRGRT